MRESIGNQETRSQHNNTINLGKPRVVHVICLYVPSESPYTSPTMENKIFLIFLWTYLGVVTIEVVAQKFNETVIKCENSNYVYCEIRDVCLSKDKCLYNDLKTNTSTGIVDCPSGFSRCSEDKNTGCWRNNCDFCQCSSSKVICFLEFIFWIN